MSVPSDIRLNTQEPMTKDAERWFVPDLVPNGIELCSIFVGESPHKDELKPERKIERSPFRGSAGKQWWLEIFGCAELPWQHEALIPPRTELEHVCGRLRIAVLNAVQYPIDPKITRHYPACVPREYLQFDKGTRDVKGNGKGPFGYKTVLDDQNCTGPVGERIIDLARRLKRFSKMPAQIVCLGDDSEWFVRRAIQQLTPGCALKKKLPVTISHPARWKYSSQQLGRNYREDAVRTLKQLIEPAS